MTALVRELHAENLLSKRGKPFDKGFIYKLLNNRIYIGEAVHKGIAYPGEHDAIVERDCFDNVQAVLATNGRMRAAATRRTTPALLKGLLFAENGRAMTPAFTKKASRLYRYYVSTDAIRGRATPVDGVPLRLSADTVEGAVLHEVRRLVRAPEIVAQTVAAAKKEAPAIEEREIVAAIHRFDDVWAMLFPAEQARIVRLLVERVTVNAQGLSLDLRAGGVAAIVQDMLAKDLLAKTPMKEEVA